MGTRGVSRWKANWSAESMRRRKRRSERERMSLKMRGRGMTALNPVVKVIRRKRRGERQNKSFSVFRSLTILSWGSLSEAKADYPPYNYTNESIFIHSTSLLTRIFSHIPSRSDLASLNLAPCASEVGRTVPIKQSHLRALSMGPRFLAESPNEDNRQVEPLPLLGVSQDS